MKIIGAILGVMALAMGITASISAADYSKAENICEMWLSNYNNGTEIVAPEVSIGPYQVDMKYVSTSTTKGDFLNSIGMAVYVYSIIVANYPKVGNLLLTFYDINKKPLATLSCQNSWVNRMDVNDTRAGQELMQKVMSTAQILESSYTSTPVQYDPRIAKLYGPTETNWLDDRSG